MVEFMPSSATKQEAEDGMNSTITGSDTFYVSECKGEGGFAKVFAATKQEAEDGMNSTISGIDAVLKVQKPANDWEWYVCREVGLRVPPALRQAFMASPRNY